MATQIDTAQREIVLVKDARIRPMMGNNVLESLPLPGIPYSIVDPYILVHEATIRITPEQASQDTTHPHRGFDNLWYAISGSSSTTTPPRFWSDEYVVPSRPTVTTSSYFVTTQKPGPFGSGCLYTGACCRR